MLKVDMLVNRQPQEMGPFDEGELVATTPPNHDVAVFFIETSQGPRETILSALAAETQERVEEYEKDTPEDNKQ